MKRVRSGKNCHRMHSPRILLAGVVVIIACGRAAAQPARRYVCGGSGGGQHAFALSSTTIYGEAAKRSDTGTAYGFDLDTVPGQIEAHSCSSTKPFFFSVAAHDGNYRVTLVLGGKAASVNTVKAESRRLLVDQMAVAAGASQKIVFTVNVRTPEIAGTETGAKVRLKPREIGALDWDHKLTLEFNGDHPSVRSITIQEVADVPTVYIAGDSTVVDQTKEPWAAWGQMLPMFFGPKIAMADEAESGETIRSFVSERTAGEDHVDDQTRRLSDDAVRPQ